MANTMILAKDVGRVFLEDAHKTMAENFPKMERDTKEYKEYNETLAKVLIGAFGGLFYGPCRGSA